MCCKYFKGERVVERIYTMLNTITWTININNRLKMSVFKFNNQVYFIQFYYVPCYCMVTFVSSYNLLNKW